MATMTDYWVTHPGHHDEDGWSDDALTDILRPGGGTRLLPPAYGRHQMLLQGPNRVGAVSPFSAHTFGSSATPDSLRRRLDNANRYFHRKATEVFCDDAALRLLVAIYEVGVIDLESFDAGKYGVALAKLTAAYFCEIGAKVIYITESGQQFIESIG